MFKSLLQTSRPFRRPPEEKHFYSQMKNSQARIPPKQAMASNRHQAAPGPQQGRRRMRTKFNKDQYNVLIEAFENNRYPDFSKREELAELTQIPKARIQVWFQNRRARIAKKNQTNLNKKVHWAQVSISDLEWPGGFALNCFGLPKPQRKNSYFSCKSEHASHQDQATLWGHTGVLGLSTGDPYLGTPASMPGQSSRDFYFPSWGPPEFPPALQRPFPHLEAENAGTQVCLETSALFLHGDPALQGSGQHPSSKELQLLWDWTPPLPAVKPEVALGHPETWEQPEPSPSQLFWPESESPTLQWPLEMPTEPAECQELCFSSCMGYPRALSLQQEPHERCMSGYYH